MKNPEMIISRQDSHHGSVVELSHELEWVGRVGGLEKQAVARAGAQPVNRAKNFVDCVMHREGNLLSSRDETMARKYPKVNGRNVVTRAGETPNMWL